MSGIDLPVLWFILVTCLFAGYFLLEGFDFGVGMLLPFLGGT
jgi:cytochrome d ubiquinol oxidase subunit II